MGLQHLRGGYTAPLRLRQKPYGDRPPERILFPVSRSPISRSSLSRSSSSRSGGSRALILLVVVIVALVGGLFFLSGSATEKPPVTVEKPVALENLAN